jgi:hypothetical protein
MSETVPVLVIELFPMTFEGGVAETHEEVDHWDLLLRPDGRAPLAEQEGLTRDEAGLWISKWVKAHPFAEVNLDLEDLLR